MSVAMKVLIEEKFTFMKDYLNISSASSVLATLGRYGEKEPNGVCMSDFIVLYDNKMRSKRMRLLICDKTLLIFSGSGKWIVKRRYTLESLKEVIISSSDFTWMVLKFNKGFDLLIETYRRLDIILYIAEAMKK